MFCASIPRSVSSVHYHVALPNTRHIASSNLALFTYTTLHTLAKTRVEHTVDFILTQNLDKGLRLKEIQNQEKPDDDVITQNQSPNMMSNLIFQFLW